mmetsp:Transcript_16993/g.26191  ORF Transcript_16993/g.26191 Transcript_16993/m.26191 type:complete len:109 (-) Transcript_16993:1034-1360(-)
MKIDLSQLNPTENLLFNHRSSPFDSNFHKYFSVSSAAKIKPLPVPESISEERHPVQKERYRTLLNDLCLDDEKIVTKVKRDRTPGKPYMLKNQTPFTISTHALSSSIS